MPALTKATVDRARYRGDGNRRDVRWDTKVVGFGCRVYPSGRKSWVLKYHTRAGRTRLMVLGAVGVLTLDQARKRAKKELVKVGDGADPVTERRADRQASTVRELAALYLERHSKQEKKSWKEDQRRLDKYVKPQLGHLTLAAVKRSDVSALHHKVGARGRYEANRVLALVSNMYAKAKEWGLVADSAPNPASGVTPFAEKSRDRWVTEQEMPALAKAINAEPNVYIRGLVWLDLLTGCRRGELMVRRWDEVDEGRRTLRLADTKNGEPRYVALSSAAWAVLEQIPRQAGNPYIFCGHKKGTHLVNVAKAWGRIREAAGCADVRLHDLRRTVGSWLATSGASLQLIGAVLGHLDSDTTRIYARLADDAPRRALEEHGTRLMAVVNGNGTDPAAERERRIRELEEELARLREAAS